MTRSKHLVFGFPKEGLVKDVNFDAQTVRVALYSRGLCLGWRTDRRRGNCPCAQTSEPDAGMSQGIRTHRLAISGLAIFTGIGTCCLPEPAQAGMHYWASRCPCRNFRRRRWPTSQLQSFCGEALDGSSNFPSCARNKSCSPVSRCRKLRVASVSAAI